MTLGQKLKEYRKTFGISQEELAEKINVSRQAITKWERDDGLPDIINLKELASIFAVSVDFLLDDKKQVEYPLLKIKIELDKNSFSKRYDYVLKFLRKNYPDDSIYGLSEIKKDKSKIYNIANILSWNIIGFIDWINDPAIWFVVEKSIQSLIVKATKEYIEIRELSSVVDTNEFTFDDARLIKMKKKL